MIHSSKEESFSEKVWRYTSKIPNGKITTYKLLGDAMQTRAYRAIGMALSKNPYAPKVPCHRVVSSTGYLHGFKGKKQIFSTLNDKAILLEKEGIFLEKVKNDYKIINFENTIYKFE